MFTHLIGGLLKGLRLPLRLFPLLLQGHDVGVRWVVVWVVVGGSCLLQDVISVCAGP